MSFGGIIRVLNYSFATEAEKAEGNRESEKDEHIMHRKYSSSNREILIHVVKMPRKVTTNIAIRCVSG